MSPTLQCPRCQTQLAAGAIACFRCGFALEQKSAGNTRFTAATHLAGASDRLIDRRWLPIDVLSSAREATVWSARDVELDRRVLVKFLAPTVSKDAGEIFARSLKSVARIDQPNVVTVLALGEHAGQHYWVTPLEEGAPLSQKFESGGLPAEDALRIIEQLVEALEALHAQNVFHRDVSSSTARIDAFDHVVLLEPGIGRVDPKRAKGGALIYGSHNYMAPELILGNRPADARTDVYALAALTFEALTGKTPFHSAEAEMAFMGHLNVVPPDLTAVKKELPPALNTVVRRALAKRAEERWPNPTSFLRAMQAVVFPDLKLHVPGLSLQRTITGEQPGMSVALSSAPASEDGAAKTEAIVLSPEATRLISSGPGAIAAAETTRSDISAAELIAAAMTDKRPAAPAPEAESGTTKMYSVDMLPRSKRQMLQENLPQILLGTVALGVLVLGGIFAKDELIGAKPFKPPEAEKIAASKDVAPMVVAPPVDSTESVTANDRKQGADVVTEEPAEADESETARASVPHGGGGKGKGDGLRPPAIGEARITATFQGQQVAADLYVNKTWKGKTPAYLKLKNGIYKFKVEQHGKPPAVMELIVETDKHGFEFEMELVPAIVEKLNLKLANAKLPNSAPAAAPASPADTP